MRKLLLFLFICSVGTFLTNCEKEDKLKQEPIDETYNTLPKINDGVLYFKDTKHFDKFYERIMAIPFDERTCWETKTGFISMERELEQLNKMIENANEYVDIDKIAKESSEFLENNDGVLSLKIHAKSMSYFINKKGYIVIGGQAHKFTNFGQITSTKGDLKILENSTKQTKSAGVYILDVSNSPKSACGSTQYGIKYNSDNDRKAVLLAELQYFWEYIDEYTGQVHYVTKVWVRGDAYKKNWLRNWVAYKTNNWLGLNYAVLLNNGIYRTNNTNPSNTDSQSIRHENFIFDGTINIADAGNYQGSFTYMDVVKYYHQGMGGIDYISNWLIFQCTGN